MTWHRSLADLARRIAIDIRSEGALKAKIFPRGTLLKIDDRLVLIGDCTMEMVTDVEKYGISNEGCGCCSFTEIEPDTVVQAYALLLGETGDET